jgi:hypothetical protein
LILQIAENGYSFILFLPFSIESDMMIDLEEAISLDDNILIRGKQDGLPLDFGVCSITEIYYEPSSIRFSYNNIKRYK